MRTDWDGFYLDGRTPVRRPARVRLTRGGIEITPEGAAPAFWPYTDVRQTQGSHAGEEVRLEHGPSLGETVIVPDSQFLADLREIAQAPALRFHDPRRRGRRVAYTIAAGVAIIVICAALYLWGIPAAASVVAARVPVSWEESLGSAVVDSLMEGEKRCNDPEGQRILDGLVGTLAAAAPRSPYTFRVQVADVKVVNAFAVPGGHMVVLRGLLDELRRPEELAGVLAHEMQHVLQRHSTKAIVQHVSTGLLIAAISGDVSGPLAYGLESARVLGQMRYSRSAEDEADTQGMALVIAAGLDPRGMIDFFEALERKERDPAGLFKFLSSHPGTGDRITRLRRLAANAPPPRRLALDPADWTVLRGICKTAGEPTPAGGPDPARKAPAR
jgi:Zn-dependent protease with chaperone function